MAYFRVGLQVSGQLVHLAQHVQRQYAILFAGIHNYFQRHHTPEIVFKEFQIKIYLI